MFSRSKGDLAETAAQEFLCKQGLKKVTRNFLCKMGEIDLIMLDGEFLVFIEIRLRNHQSFGSGAESIQYNKQRRIIKTAEYYLQQNHQEPPFCRFDVVSMSGEKGNYQFDWISDAFQAF